MGDVGIIGCTLSVLQRVVSTLPSTLAGDHQVALEVKNPPAMQEIRGGLDPWVGKIPWSRKWQPTLIFLPGESHGQRSLAGYHPWGHKQSSTTEAT